MKETALNTIRNFFPDEIEALKPLLRAAYKAVLCYQTDRGKAEEAAMRYAIAQTLPILAVFKPHLPVYKRRYVELLEQDAALTAYDLVVCFDRAIYELHARVKCGEYAHLPYSENLRELLDERRQAVPSAPRSHQESLLASGKGVCGGSVEGIARIVQDARGLGAVQPGEIVVMPMTDPDFIRVADRAAALVTDQGGLLCHAAILARELNLPCIVGCHDATQTIATGQRVRVDGVNGLVLGITAP